MAKPDGERHVSVTKVESFELKDGKESKLTTKVIMKTNEGSNGELLDHDIVTIMTQQIESKIDPEPAAAQPAAPPAAAAVPKKRISEKQKNVLLVASGVVGGMLVLGTVIRAQNRRWERST
ncbi:MAG: hypothetical protein Hyperionvirus2_112 [Hyperionvirus sp.]|uniref:Uncharacterized protein n=1 Tax=Hyperionvirus sp. TaxID=2487770 RepID=A0A3G5A890_9VIRU|nr:MAG: hypothetical protein Hyperionvirus2_112 [Hyperionvirus sp.]